MCSIYHRNSSVDYTQASTHHTAEIVVNRLLDDASSVSFEQTPPFAIFKEREDLNSTNLLHPLSSSSFSQTYS
ncbi:hypothetical protein ABKN59_010636 [Abortiporus biennis]